MKIIVKTEKKTKSFKTQYYANAGALSIEGMGIMGLIILISACAIVPSLSKFNGNNFYAIILVIPVLLFLVYLLNFFWKNKSDHSNVEIDLKNSILRIGKHSWKIKKGKWFAKKKNFNAGRAIIVNSFDYFELLIPTSADYPDINITTTAFIELKEFLEKNSDLKIGMAQESVFD